MVLTSPPDGVGRQLIVGKTTTRWEAGEERSHGPGGLMGYAVPLSRRESSNALCCLVATLVLSVDQAEEVIVHVVLARAHRHQLEALREEQRVTRGATNDQLARHEDKHRRSVHTHLHLLRQTSHIVHNGSHGLSYNDELGKKNKQTRGCIR